MPWICATIAEAICVQAAAAMHGLSDPPDCEAWCTYVLVADAARNAKGLGLGAPAVQGPAQGHDRGGARQLPVDVMLDAAIHYVKQQA